MRSGCVLHSVQVLGLQRVQVLGLQRIQVLGLQRIQVNISYTPLIQQFPICHAAIMLFRGVFAARRRLCFHGDQVNQLGRVLLPGGTLESR